MEARDALNDYRSNDAQDKTLALARRNEGVMDLRNRGDIGEISQARLRSRIDSGVCQLLVVAKSVYNNMQHLFDMIIPTCIRAHPTTTTGLHSDGGLLMK
ncbi:predicted protein [Lichtheimia corymbifera JMRC:FSU:9682]|uniref:Uncharacterized protein n=1 Tax=Lichtheimia corymbifera JMRC:FSU:9682 TaxID=1263082 RepID=A0A068RFV3_9FUNG|nr:predicted protein [Lichtheimia corymbifera JMRC:FSU:9682]